MTNTQYGAGEFLALLLKHICQVYSDDTDDFASMYALDIAIAAMEADEKMSEQSAEMILEHMASLAGCLIGASEFSPAIRARLEVIRNTHPDFAEPASTGVAS